MKKWQPLLFAVLVSLGIGMVAPFAGSSQGLQSLYALLLIISLYWWLQIDSNQYPEKNLGLYKVWAGLLTLIGLPIYFIKSRGFKGSLLPTVLSIVVIVGLVIFSAFGSFLSRILFFK